MRGEHPPYAAVVVQLSGSSPHARGAHGMDALTQLNGGIIPACAGSTRALAAPCCYFWDHPRMRGEHRQRDEAR